eukprot:1148620-Pelagomonas_calceolata.AAC.4
MMCRMSNTFFSNALIPMFALFGSNMLPCFLVLSSLPSHSTNSVAPYMPGIYHVQLAVNRFDWRPSFSCNLPRDTSIVRQAVKRLD